MSSQAFIYNVEVKGNLITVKWKHAEGIMPIPLYPELEFTFDYLNISTDTVRAMLRDMEVPDFLANAVMTRITADAS